MDEFAGDACKTVAAQICEAVGFEAVTASSLDTLSEVLVKFLDEVGFHSHSLAELSGRTHDNALDVLAALEEVGTSAWELRRFMDRNELRYAKPEVHFPVSVEQRPRARFGQDETEPLPPHVPSFLPEFPAKHTYKSSEKEKEPRGGARQLKKQKNKQRHQLETSLLKLSDAGKKRKAAAAFGQGAEEQGEKQGGDRTITPADVSEAKAQMAPVLSDAARLNDLLTDPGLAAEIAGAPALPQVATSEGGGSSARPFALSLPAPASTGMQEREARDGAAGQKDHKKRDKATKILATPHDKDGLQEAAEGGRSPGDPGGDDEMMD